MDDNCIHGINKLKKPATKVIAPPGGKTNINIFGGDEPAPVTPVNPYQKKRNESSIFGQPPANNNIVNPVNSVKTNAAENALPRAPAPVPTVAASSEPINNIPTAPGGGRASTKVIAPPGGRSSINLFG